MLDKQDGASLVRAAVSKEAKAFRFQLCKIIADILYQRMVKALGQLVPASQYSYKLRLAGGHQNTELHPSPRLSTSPTVYDYQSLLSDRRLKLILSKILKSARKEPALMLRFYWVSFVTFITASALAFHRLLISLSAAYIGPASFIPKRFAVTAWNFSRTLQWAYSFPMKKFIQAAIGKCLGWVLSSLVIYVCKISLFKSFERHVRGRI